MAKIVVECSNPNDLSALEAAVEQAAGKCNVTYFKQHKALVDASKSTSQRDSARKIAKETGESPAAVESRIRRGKDQVRQHDAVVPYIPPKTKKPLKKGRWAPQPGQLLDDAVRAFLSTMRGAISQINAITVRAHTDDILSMVRPTLKEESKVIGDELLVWIRKIGATSSESERSVREGMKMTCPRCGKTHMIPWANVEKALLQRESNNTLTRSASRPPRR